MAGIGSPESAQDARPARRPKPTGAWVGYLVFGLCLLILIAFDVQAAYYDQWLRLGLTILVTVAYMLVPTGWAKWLRRELQRRNASTSR